MEKEVKSTSIDYLERHRQRKEFEEQQAKKIDDFLLSHSPKVIANKLKEHIVGQDELIKAVAEFYYYQVLRFKYPLPSRPMMIFGPSGSGKTEVWRVISKLFPDILRICIVDASRITSDGWRGDLKVASFMKPYMSHGILVFDNAISCFPHVLMPMIQILVQKSKANFLRLLKKKRILSLVKPSKRKCLLNELVLCLLGHSKILE